MANKGFHSLTTVTIDTFHCGVLLVGHWCTLYKLKKLYIEHCLEVYLKFVL